MVSITSFSPVVSLGNELPIPANAAILDAKVFAKGGSDKSVFFFSHGDNEVGYYNYSNNEVEKKSMITLPGDEKVVYIIKASPHYAERKTYMAVSMQQATEGKLWGVETMETANRSTTREFVQNETIEGWERTFWSVTGKSVTKGGHEEGWTRKKWQHEPTKIVIRGTDPNRGRGYLIRRKIVVGAQPESIFVIPRDYAAMNVPIGKTGDPTEMTINR